MVVLTMTLKPGDIFFTRGCGVVSKGIRFFSRSIGESKTQVNHVGVVVCGGLLETAVIVESRVGGVRRHTLWSKYAGGKHEVAVYRPLNLTKDEKWDVVCSALHHLGQKYGYIKLVAHMLDYMLLGAYVFRRLVRIDNYPICSYLVAHVYGYVGKGFDVAVGEASPDDIWDFVVGNSGIYECVRELEVM